MMHGSYVPPNLDASSVVGSVAMSAAESKLQQAGLKTQSDEARRKKEERSKMVTIISTSVASMAMVTAVIAMWWEASVIAYVAFAFPLVTAPLAITQRRKLHKMSTFQQEVNAVRLLVNDLAVENDRLVQENYELEKQVEKLHHVEQDFDNLARQSGKDVTHMRQLAKDYSQIQKEMNSINQTIKMQKFLTAVLRSDTNHNFQLDSPHEVDMLVMRLKSIGGIKFDEKTLRDSIHDSDKKSLSTIYQVASGTLEQDDGVSEIEMT